MGYGCNTGVFRQATYTMVARDEGSQGIPRELLKPGGIAPGYPNVFTYPEEPGMRNCRTEP